MLFNVLLPFIFAQFVNSWHFNRCPEKCACYENADKLKTLDCSSKGLTIFPDPEFIPADVNVIDLSKNNIDFVKSNLKFWLPELISLDLSSNRLAGVPVLSIPSLLKLNLSNNRISSLDSYPFRSVNQLHFLDLSRNRIGDLEYGTFQHLNILWHLDLSFNKLTNLPTLNNQNQLNELLLHHNELSSIERRRLLLPSLSRLDLSNNAIRFLEEMAFAGCPCLRFLNLASNKLIQVPRQAFLYNSLIAQIDLHNNPIVAIREGDFTALPQLREINLSGTNIDHVEENAFENLVSLVRIYLNDNSKLMFLAPGSFKNLPSITTLFLHNANLSTIYNVAEEISNLKILTLYGNPLICDCNLKWLQQYIQKYPLPELDKLLCYSENSGQIKLIKNTFIETECLPRIVSQLSKLETYENQFLKLSCEAIGNPQPEIKWYSPQKKLISRSKYLILGGVSVIQQGSYECVAKSSKGSVTSKLQLKVKSRVRLDVKMVTPTAALLEWSKLLPKYTELKVWSENGHHIWSIISPLSQRSLFLDSLSPSTAYQACLTDSSITLSCTSFVTPQFNSSILFVDCYHILTVFGILSVLIGLLVFHYSRRYFYTSMHAYG